MEVKRDSDDDEIKRLMKVWITIFASLVYCYYISKQIPKGKIRLIFFLPINIIFIILPLYLSVSNPLMPPTGYFIGWIANFKLLLFAFDKGSLNYSSNNPPISLSHFITIACLPIIIKQNPHSKSKIKQNPCLQINKSSQVCPEKEPPHESLLNYAIKGLVLVMLHCFCHYYNHYSNKYILLLLQCCHIYFVLEISQAIFAVIARYILHLEFEPAFNHPILSTSLQNFWGKRWNLVAQGVVRETIYEPVKSIYTRMFGKRWATSFAVVTTFALSGLMHEIAFFYTSRLTPRWDVFWSFVFHGICVAVEIEVKKKVNGRWQLHRLVSGMLTIGYVICAGIWLETQSVRCGWDGRNEFNFVRELVNKSSSMLYSVLSMKLFY